jgi:hypothetical protein
MATILEFRDRSTRTDVTSGKTVRGGPAEVVIFPGVRYERYEEPRPARTKSRRSRQHDRIELED